MVTVIAAALGIGAGASGNDVTIVPALLSRAGNTNVVYITASTGCAAERCLRLYRSNINASSFVKVTSPPVQGERGGRANTTLDQLIFATPKYGYALVGAYSESSMYVTTNGARTWRKVISDPDTFTTLVATSNEIYVTSVRCKPRSIECGQTTVRRSSFSAKHWVTLPRLWRTGTGPKDVYYGPSVAAYGNNVWEVENTNKGTALWISHNRGRTFTPVMEKFPQLGAVVNCTLTPMSNVSLWAECPTGMEESFWHSSDGGLHWTDLFPDEQYSGTGGGAFAPVSSDVAYLDFGISLSGRNIYRITDGGERSSAVSERNCSSVYSLVFIGASRGLMVCNENYSTAYLLRTINGGVKWRRVLLS
jgi:photosystem II stability/assembly factor-like uncharacterized protein